MNREIKFRMWNNVSESPNMSKYFYDLGQVIPCLMQQICFDAGLFGYNHIGHGSRFEQFTGLLDKNGKEIYEGDIVKAKDFMCVGHQVVENQFVMEPTEVYDDVIDVVTYGEGMYSVGHIPLSVLVDDGQTEVLGNVHQNPELLK